MLFEKDLRGLPEHVRSYIENTLEKSVLTIAYALDASDADYHLTLLRESAKLKAAIDLARDLQDQLDAEATDQR